MLAPICCPICQTTRATQVELVRKGNNGVLSCEHCGYCYLEPTAAKDNEALRMQNELVLAVARKRAVVEYRVTQTTVPLGLPPDFEPRAPDGIGWKPMGISGNEVVFYCLWKRESTVDVAQEETQCPEK